MRTKHEFSKSVENVRPLDSYMPSQVVLVVKNLSVNAEDTRDAGSILGLGRSPGVGNGTPLQSFLQNPMDRGVWRAWVHRVAKSWI